MSETSRRCDISESHVSTYYRDLEGPHVDVCEATYLIDVRQENHYSRNIIPDWACLDHSRFQGKFEPEARVRPDRLVALIFYFNTTHPNISEFEMSKLIFDQVFPHISEDFFVQLGEADLGMAQTFLDTHLPELAIAPYVGMFQCRTVIKQVRDAV